MSDSSRQNSPDSAAEMRRASVAMQRAAEAMIAATESFRRQFQQMDAAARQPTTYRPYRRSEDQPGPEPSHSSAEERQSLIRDAGTSWHAPVPAYVTASEQTLVNSSRPSTDPDVQPTQPAELLASRPFSAAPASIGSSSHPPRYAQTPSNTLVPAPPPLAQFLAGLAETSQAPGYPQRSVPGADSLHAIPIHAGEMTPPRDWPVRSSMASPVLSSSSSGQSPVITRKPVSSRAAGSVSHFSSPRPTRLNTPDATARPPSAGHMDLMEAAMRMRSESSTRPYQQSPLAAVARPISPDDRFGSVNYARVHQRHDSGDVSPLSEHQVKAALPRAWAAAAPAAQKGPFPIVHEVFFVFVICMAQVLMLAGMGQALAPAAIIGQSFAGTTAGDLAWYSAAYGLTAGTFVLPAGRLGDLFGHKRVFTLGFLWFALWSVLAGLARYAQQGGANGTVYFCFCRAMQGIGPAMQVPNGQAMLGKAYLPGPRKAMVLSLFGASAPLGFVTGAVMASLFAVRASWEWAFFVLAAVNLAMAALGGLVLPGRDPVAAAASRAAAAKAGESLWTRLDGAGVSLGVAGLVLFNFAWNQAPIVSWTTPYAYFLLVIGSMFLVAFVAHERRAPYPLVPVSAMTTMTNFVLACTGAGWGCFSVWVYYSFQISELLRGWSPLLTSGSFAHGPLSGLVASVLTGVLLGKLHWRPQWVMLISMCAFFVGSLLAVTAPVEQSYWLNTFFSILVMPFGMDMSNPAATILLSNSVSAEHQGIAASLVVTVVNYSISLALGMAGTVETQLNDGGRDLLRGFRGAQYFGLGLGTLGVVLAVMFVVISVVRRPSAPTKGVGPA